MCPKLETGGALSTKWPPGSSYTTSHYYLLIRKNSFKDISLAFPILFATSIYEASQRDMCFWAGLKIRSKMTCVCGILNVFNCIYGITFIYSFIDCIIASNSYAMELRKLDCEVLMPTRLAVSFVDQFAHPAHDLHHSEQSCGVRATICRSDPL